MVEGQTAKPRWSMVRRECAACGHEWVQPSATGACPRCHAEQAKNLDTRINALRRV